MKKVKKIKKYNSGHCKNKVCEVDLDIDKRDFSMKNELTTRLERTLTN